MDPPDPGHSPEQAVTASDRAARISVALRRLPAPDRELLALLMDSSSSYRAVSAELKMPVGSIGPKRARSLERLRRELTPWGSTASSSAYEHGFWLSPAAPALPRQVTSAGRRATSVRAGTPILSPGRHPDPAADQHH